MPEETLNVEKAESPLFRRPVWRFVRAFAIAYLIVLLAMTCFETAMLYPRPPRERFEQKPRGIVYEEVYFNSADGTKLHGWFFPKENAKRAIVYFHGNAECVADNASYMDELRRDLDAAMFIFDYRGYGYSEGTPHEAGLIADGIAAQKWLAGRLGMEPHDVVLMGRSIGGAVAVAVAAENGAAALVLVNSFSKLTNVAAYHMPWLPVKLLMKNRYDSAERIGRYSGPVFQTHGDCDKVVPLQFGKQLYEAIPGKQKRFIEFAGCYHNDPLPSDYNEQLAEFLDQQTSPRVE